MITITVPLPPSSNRLWHIVRDQRTRSPRIAKTPAYKAWLISTGYLLNTMRLSPVSGPYSLRLVVSRQTGMDLGNVEKATSDLLQTHKLIQNDALAERIELVWEDVAGERVDRGMMKIEINEVDPGNR